MSQFRTLSAEFKKALEDLSEQLSEKESKKTSSTGLDNVRAFFEGPVKTWYEALDQNDRGEVDRLFSELSNLSTDDVIGLMKAEKHASPFGLVGGLFKVAGSQENISEVEV
jgi:hypothetical protein